jgi:hypothetical protein
MPIQINLLHEALAQEDLRRRDPVKRAIFWSALALALTLVWYSSTSLEHMVANSDFSKAQAEVQAHTNDYNIVVANLKKITDVQNHLKSLDELSSARFLQGNLMNALQKLYVPNVCLMRMQVNQTYTRKSPTSIAEHTVLTLDAKDFSANPGDQVNHYKDAISGLDYFKSNLDTNGGVNLSNLSPPQSASDNKPFVLFTVECHFSDQTR